MSCGGEARDHICGAARNEVMHIIFVFHTAILRFHGSGRYQGRKKAFDVRSRALGREVEFIAQAFCESDGSRAFLEHTPKHCAGRIESQDAARVRAALMFQKYYIIS